MLRKIDLKDIPPKRKYIKSSVMLEIEEFLRSGEKAAEIVTDGYKSAETAASSYGSAVRRCKYGVRIAVRGYRVFMIREDEKNDQA